MADTDAGDKATAQKRQASDNIWCLGKDDPRASSVQLMLVDREEIGRPTRGKYDINACSNGGHGAPPPLN